MQKLFLFSILQESTIFTIKCTFFKFENYTIFVIDVGFMI